MVSPSRLGPIIRRLLRPDTARHARRRDGRRGDRHRLRIRRLAAARGAGIRRRLGRGQGTKSVATGLVLGHTSRQRSSVPAPVLPRSHRPDAPTSGKQSQTEARPTGRAQYGRSAPSHQRGTICRQRPPQEQTRRLRLHAADESASEQVPLRRKANREERGSEGTLSARAVARHGEPLCGKRLPQVRVGG